MKFNYFGKTKMILAIVTAVIVVAYIAAMAGAFGNFIKYEEPDYKMEMVDGKEVFVKDENGDYIEIVKEKEASQLGYVWLPTEHAKVFGTQIEEFVNADIDPAEEAYEFNVNDVAPIWALLFALGIVLAILAIVSVFTKKILWSYIAAIWGILAVYCCLTNPAVKAAGAIECLSGAGLTATIQTAISYASCVIGIASLVIAIYAKRKNKKMLMESILKREQ